MTNLKEAFDEVFRPGVPVVFLHAHPDDESFLSAGILSELVLRGRDVIVVYAAASLVAGADKTMIRREEAARACNLLGVKKVLYLPFCEPKYDGMGVATLVGSTLDDVVKSFDRILKSEGPHGQFILVAYDENGGYGNRDHKVVHALGRAYTKGNPDHVARMLEVTIDRDGMKSWLDGAVKRLGEQSLPKLSYWSEKFGLSRDEIGFFHELSDAQLHLKRLALAAHESQVRLDEFPLSLSGEDFRDLFGREYLIET
jgi:LmbE family N-acetylglucosaminyl deacetylase